MDIVRARAGMRKGLGQPAAAADLRTRRSVRTGPWTHPATVLRGPDTYPRGTRTGAPPTQDAVNWRRRRRPHSEQSSHLQLSVHRARMALTRGSPEPHARALPSAWTYSDGGSTLQEAQEALDTYKKKDGNKGACAYDGLCASRAGCELTCAPHAQSLSASRQWETHRS